MENIPVLDLKKQYDSIKTEIDAAIQSVLNSTAFVLGPAVKALEQAVSAYCECSAGVGVASGTDALRLSLAAFGVGPADEVITTPFTFIATGNTISRSGAKPVFVDIALASFNLDTAQLDAAVTKRTKAIVPVHLYGHPAEMDDVMAVARKHGLAVVEDCAQAIGARYRGRRIGSFGNAGCLSFFPSKNLGGYGDGGMVVTNDAALASIIDLLRRHGSRKKYFAEVVGYNSRLDTLQAAILDVKLKYLDDWNAGRRRVAAAYEQMLAGSDVDTVGRPARGACLPPVHH